MSTTTPPSAPFPASSVLTDLRFACDKADWDAVEGICLNYLCQCGEDAGPEELVTRTALMAALRRSGQCYDYADYLEGVIEDFTLYATLADDGGEACAHEIDAMLALFLADGHPIREHIAEVAEGMILDR